MLGSNDGLDLALSPRKDSFRREPRPDDRTLRISLESKAKLKKLASAKSPNLGTYSSAAFIE